MVVRSFWTKYQTQLMLALAAILLLAEVLGQLIGWDSLKLLPAVLAIITALALLNWQVPPLIKTLLVVGVIIFSWLAETIGVHSGWLFGSFTFSDGLGFKLLAVPPAISFLWFLVSLSAWQIVALGRLKLLHRFLLAGGLAVIFDLLLEQFAGSYTLWSWTSGHVPILNYITWFLVSEVLFYIYYRYAKVINPDLFIAGLLPLMALFFWLMLLVR
jgi:putative membrane protein